MAYGDKKGAVDDGARAILITPVSNFAACSRLSPAPVAFPFEGGRVDGGASQPVGEGASRLYGEGTSRPDGEAASRLYGEGTSRPDGEGVSRPHGDVACEDFDSQPTNPSQDHPDHPRLWDMSIDGSQNSDRVLESPSQ